MNLSADKSSADFLGETWRAMPQLRAPWDQSNIANQQAAQYNTEFQNHILLTVIVITAV